MWQQRDMEDGGEEWDAHAVALDTVSFSYPMRISLVLIMERKPKHLMLAEQMIFERRGSKGRRRLPGGGKEKTIRTSGTNRRPKPRR